MAHIIAFNKTDAEDTFNLLQSALESVSRDYNGLEKEATPIINFLISLRDYIEIDFDKAYR